MKTACLLAGLVLIGATSRGAAQDQQAIGFPAASTDIHQQLAESVVELGAVYERIAAEKVPLSRRLSELEAEHARVKASYRETQRLVDSRTVEVATLKGRIQTLQGEASYLSNLLDDYLRKFESRLHVAEVQRYGSSIDAARLALEDTGLSQSEVYATQLALLSVSMDRLEDALGGTRFSGTALDADRLVRHGSFALLGPLALFRSDDGRHVGTAEQRLGSHEPTLVAFAEPADTEAAAALLATGKGRWPLDASVGDAHKVAATQETLAQHIEKGGEVGYVIIALAAAAFLVALFKWIGLSLQRTPSEQQLGALIKAVSQRDDAAILSKVKAIKGPVGAMLREGVEHLRQPKELIEEVMFEKVLTTRLKLERFLPFIAVAAASAPLMGLLGTVTGIIETFKTITVMGSSDVKSLSGGISAALITTEFGLIVAIPSLLMHAFLSRKAKGVQHAMENAAVAFVNQVARTPMVIVASAPSSDELLAAARPDPEAVRREVRATLADMLAPVTAGSQAD